MLCKKRLTEKERVKEDRTRTRAVLNRRPYFFIFFLANFPISMSPRVSVNFLLKLLEILDTPVQRCREENIARLLGVPVQCGRRAVSVLASKNSNDEICRRVDGLLLGPESRPYVLISTM